MEAKEAIQAQQRGRQVMRTRMTLGERWDERSDRDPKLLLYSTVILNCSGE